ncbi:hypothetical protein [Pedobacter sp. L105]|uniref:hypothetical protein n=1 Tax=Pedobacter sp. L105 TaxID=1641871 RepID=UPI00131E23E6|nr:hypothetical protein [Pedobacter sp. L105]
MKYSLTFLFCLCALFSSAQNLELNQLKSFIFKPAIEVTDTLQKKGWVVRPELSGKKLNQLYQTFSFGHLKKEKAKARAWFRIHADNGIVNQMYYQVPGLKEYTLLLEEIKKTATERKNEQSIEDNKLSTYYIADGYVFETTVAADSYTIMVMTDRAF